MLPSVRSRSHNASPTDFDEMAAGDEFPPARAPWHVGIEAACYLMAFAMPWFLRPVIHGALPSDPWRLGAMAAVTLTLVATGLCVRVRWPLSWIPACALTGIFCVVISPWHSLTVSFAVLEILVLFATQVLPDSARRSEGVRQFSSALSFSLLVIASLAVGYAIRRMSVVAGFPLSLAQALPSPKVALIYLRDNPRALTEIAPGGLPWALYAAKHSEPLVLEAVLAAGAPIGAYDYRQHGSPMEWFAANVDFEDPHAEAKVRLLSRYGAPPAGAAIAAKRGHHSLVKALLELGDDVNVPDASGTSPIASLIETNAVSAVSCLLANGVQILPSYGRLSHARPVNIPSAAMQEVLAQYEQELAIRRTY